MNKLFEILERMYDKYSAVYIQETGLVDNYISDHATCPELIRIDSMEDEVLVLRERAASPYARTDVIMDSRQSMRILDTQLYDLKFAILSR